MMSDAILPAEVSNSVQEIVAALNEAGKEKPGTSCFIKGQFSSGKSTVLRLLKKEIKSAKPVLVNPPLSQYDSGQIAMLQVAEELDATAEFISILKDPSIAWHYKLELLANELNKQKENIVLLLDEPEKWGYASEDESSFHSKGHEIADVLAKFSGSKIISGQYSSAYGVTKVFTCNPNTNINHFQAQAQNWNNKLSESAFALFKDLPKEKIGTFSPLQLRLLVGLSLLRGPNWVHARFLDFRDRSRISQELISALKDQNRIDLLQSWYMASLIREPLDGGLFSLVSEKLTEQDLDFLRTCLMYRTDSVYELHESLRRDIQQADVEKISKYKTEMHGKLAQHYKEVFEKNSQRSRVSMEAYFHAIESGNIHWLIEAKPYFVDQLNYTGYKLSRHLHRYSDAVKVFNASLQWDPNDAYALHYYAYNLDLQGKDAKKVEEFYNKALDISPNVIRFHTHKIAYLIARGRSRDAEMAWGQALDNLAIGDVASNESLFELLHSPIGQLFISRGKYKKGREILSSIPQSFRSSQDNLYLKLSDKIEVSEDFGSFLPLMVELNSEYSEPRNLELQLKDGSTLKEWYYGKVIEKGSDEIIGAVAKKVVNRPDFSLGKISWNTNAFHALLEDASIKKSDLGDSFYFELGLYVDHSKKTSQKPTFRMKKIKSNDGNIKELSIFPDPDRYLAKWNNEQ